MQKLYFFPFFFFLLLMTAFVKNITSAFEKVLSSPYGNNMEK